MKGHFVMKKRTLRSISAVLSAIIVISVLTLTLCSCGVGGGQVKIGIVLPNKEEEWWLDIEKSFVKLIEENGYDADIMFSQGSSSIEKANVDSFLTRGIDVLILCPHDMEAAISAVEMAKDEGVKVISFDRLITGTDALDYYVAFKTVAMGENMGQYLVDRVTLEGGTGHNLYIYAGALTDSNSYDYFRGYWKALQPKIADGTFIVRNSDAAMKYKDVADLTDDQLYEIMLPIDTQWNPEKAKTLAEADLTNASAAEKRSSYILAPNDNIARVIADTFIADSAVETFRISGMDGTEASVQYIIDGKQDMTAYGDVDDLCGTALELADALIKGDSPKGNDTTDNGAKAVESFILTTKTVTRDNIVEEFLDSGKYDKSRFTNYEGISDSVKPENYNRK